MRSCPVWDYSVHNINALASSFSIRPQWMPFAYDDVLVSPHITHTVEQDIDVLFYGTRSDRRADFIEKLQKRGLTVQALWGNVNAKYDEQLDRLIDQRSY